MNYIALVARVLLGLAFTAAGLGGFVLAVTSTPPAMPGLAGQFQSVFFQSHWVLFVDAVEFVAGALILVNRYVPLALVTLAAVIANILIFHITMMPRGIVPGLIVTALWLIVAVRVRSHFQGLLVRRCA